jgi:hypothetical protein
MLPAKFIDDVALNQAVSPFAYVAFAEDAAYSTAGS